MKNEQLIETPVVSVVMATFNETEDELKASIDSILNQTFRKFEFIIVNDNPKNNLIRQILNDYCRKDSRIVVLNNSNNIGLAMSLNRGINFSRSSLVARMDADDISTVDRLEKQLDQINNGYDFVFSNFSVFHNTIDLMENQKKHSRHYNQIDIVKKLPFENIIHHPTVLIRKEILDKSGLYREFPVAQDYDLWLRIYDCGAKMLMIDEVLLMYRIRNGSTTSSKSQIQRITSNYTKLLFYKYILTGNWNFIKTKYDNYIEKRKRSQHSYTSELNLLRKSKKSNSKVTYILLRIKVFVISKDLREGYLIKLFGKVISWKYIKNKIREVNKNEIQKD